MCSQSSLSRVCQQCGKPFTIPARYARQRPALFCSRGCSNRSRHSPEDLPGKFWARVQKSDGCWTWKGKHVSDGYGQFYLGQGHNIQAHIYAYEQLIGPVPEGAELDHLCRNRGCCNPAHLEPVTHRENVRRGNGWAGRHARKTHCPYGHPYETKVINGRERRFCRECHNEYERRHKRETYVPHPRVYIKPTHCPRGHEYNETNAHRNKNGTWICRICDRARRPRLPLDLAGEAAGG